MQRHVEDSGEAQNSLKELIEKLRDGKAINLSNYRDSYQNWTIKKLRQVLKAEAFQPDEVLKLAQNYWFLTLSPDLDPPKGRLNEILKEDWGTYSKETLEKLQILQKIAQILYPILRKYWDRKKILDVELQVILEDVEHYPWQALISAKIPE